MRHRLEPMRLVPANRWDVPDYLLPTAVDPADRAVLEDACPMNPKRLGDARCGRSFCQPWGPCRSAGSRPGRWPHAGRVPLAQRQHAGDRRPAPAPLRGRSLRDPHRRALSRRLRGDRRPGARERDAAVDPAARRTVADIGGYETVFLGFPIWGMALPAPGADLPRDARLAGKTLVPFITHGGYGTGRARHRGGARPAGADRDGLGPRGGSGARDDEQRHRLARDRRAGALKRAATKRRPA